MSKKNRNEQPRPGERPAKESRLADYFWANLIFFAFLFLLATVVYQSCLAPGDDPAVRQVLGETRKFMVYLFGGGFLVVTLFDAAYDFFAEKAGEGGEGLP